MKIKTPFLMLVAAIAAGGNLALAADNANFKPGDLVLFFQKEGSTNTIYVSLGDTALNFRGAAAGPGAPNKIDFINVSAELSSAFGAGWASDPAVYAGLAGVWGSSATGNVLQNGDPHRTLYVSSPRNGVSTPGAADSSGWTLATNTGMTEAATQMLAQNAIFDSAYATAAAVSPTSVSLIDDYNPFQEPGLQGAAFTNFGGGVQQVGQATPFGTFGAAGQVEFALDLYRILAKDTAPGQVGGPVRTGSFEGTITVSTTGKVSFVSEGGAPPLSSFQTWANTFPALDTEAKRLPSADPDGDGLTNLMEFTLNGNPGVADGAIRPAVANTTNDMVFNFNRRDEVLTGYTLRVQYGSDLTGWTDAVVPATSGSSGSTTVTVTDNGLADAVSIALPKSLGTGGKLFARLLVAENAP